MESKKCLAANFWEEIFGEQILLNDFFEGEGANRGTISF